VKIIYFVEDIRNAYKVIIEKLYERGPFESLRCRLKYDKGAVRLNAVGGCGRTVWNLLRMGSTKAL
jgi:hypothetical protein